MGEGGREGGAGGRDEVQQGKEERGGHHQHARGSCERARLTLSVSFATHLGGSFNFSVQLLTLCCMKCHGHVPRVVVL